MKIKAVFFLLCAFLLQLALFCPTAQALDVTAPGGPATPAGECIIISGGPSLILWEKWKNPPHDLWWQNFIRAAEIRIQQLKDQGVPTSQITWFVYRPAYETRARQEGQDLVADIVTRAGALGVPLKFFRTSREIVNYFNGGKPRGQVKIADLEYFGHSNKACWMFDYSNVIDSSSKAWIHEDELGRINPAIFAPGANVRSWGCHTGESMSQKFRLATGVKMWGCTGRTQYNTHELPTLADPAGKWLF